MSKEKEILATNNPAKIANIVSGDAGASKNASAENSAGSPNISDFEITNTMNLGRTGLEPPTPDDQVRQTRSLSAGQSKNNASSSAAIKDAKEPYSLKIIKMDCGDTTKRPFIPLRKDYNNTVISTWTEGNSERPIWGFVGDGKTNKFKINVQFEFKDSNGSSVPVKAEAISFTESLPAGVDAVSGAAPIPENWGKSDEVTVVREEGSLINWSPKKTKTATFTFDSISIRGFSKQFISFKWMYKNADGNWTDMERTYATVYFVPSDPNAPWKIDVNKNNQNPWTDALDMLLGWGVNGMTSATTISSQITRYVNSSINLKYDISRGATILSNNNTFKCSEFIKNVKAAKSMVGNCSDCAALVCTFSNLLGAKLVQIRFGGGVGFSCNKIKAIGYESNWQYPFPKDANGNRVAIDDNKGVRGGFSYHEIAFDGNGAYDDKIYDACLKVNKNVLNTKAAEALLPTDISFALYNDGDYDDGNGGSRIKSTDAIKYREMLILNRLVDFKNGFIDRSRECKVI